MIREQLEVSPADYFTAFPLDRSDVLGSWLSKSSIWELDSCSLYKWRYCPKQETTAAMNHGSLIDMLTTTPELAEESIVVSPYDSYRTKAAREWREEAQEGGQIIVTDSQLIEAKKAAAVLTEKHKGSAEVFEKSKTQVILTGSRQGAKLRGLVDLAPEGERYLADLKTTNKFTLDGFGKTIANYGYHAQAGLYLALWNAQFPEDQRKGFRFVWQDSAPPYEVCITELSAFDIACGLDYLDHLTGRIVQAARKNHWPMLEEGRIPMVGRPEWAIGAEDEKMAEPVEAPD